MYVTEFTDDFTRMKEIFMIKSNDHAVDFLHLFGQTMTVPLDSASNTSGQTRERRAPQVLSKSFATTPASPWSSQRPRLRNKLECRKETDVRSLLSQGAYSRTGTSPKHVGRNVF